MEGKLNIRKIYLAIGVVTMLFAGVIYAWSILKVPLGEESGWSDSQLALNYTLGLCFFCIGGFLGSQIAKRIGTKLTVVLSGIVAGAGIALVSLLSGENVVFLYGAYACLGCFGIGGAYNVLISTINSWFPDKKGFSSGCLMMGFGASALVLGNLIAKGIEIPEIGWRATYLILGIAMGAIVAIAGIIVRAPGADTELPKPKAPAGKRKENFEAKDFTPKEMLKRSSFWRAFICLVLLCACGSSVISFARDLTISVGASASLATTLVGVLSVCNGLGRIITGMMFDSFGRRTAMLTANGVAIAAMGITLLAVLTNSIILCVLGLCATGLAYGACPTVSSAFISAFYGTKHFPTNFSIINFNLIGAAFMATVSSTLLTKFGTYAAPFAVLTALAVIAFLLNLTIRKP